MAEVDRIADSGIHTLTAYRAVDVPRVAREEGPPLAEVIRHPVMNAVGREPIDLVDVNLQTVDRRSRHVLEGQGFCTFGSLVADNANQTRARLCPLGREE